MAYPVPIIQSEFISPKVGRRVLLRPRVARLMRGILEYPMTFVHAGPGYGKTTELAAFLSSFGGQKIWYGIVGSDADPVVFAASLVHAFRKVWPDSGREALAVLEGEGPSQARLTACMDYLINDVVERLDGEAILVLDDFHVVAHSQEIRDAVEHFLEFVPPGLHVCISTRRMPEFRQLAKWRLKSSVLEVTQADLAFTADEIDALFSEVYEVTLTPEFVDLLFARTEGWAIALEMVWQAMRKGVNLEAVWDERSRPLESLFDYLAEEVVAKLSPEVTEFLTATSVLSRLDPDVCDRVSGRTGSLEMIENLERSGLFVADSGSGVFRYHPLFREFLRRRLGVDSGRAAQLHRAAAEAYLDRGDPEEAIYHLARAGDQTAVATIIARIADEFIQKGRWESLIYWIDQLPPEVLAERPELLVAKGHAFRLNSRYDQAAACCDEAIRLCRAKGDKLGLSKALRAKALIYLDTVQPSVADELLLQAVRVLPPEASWQKADLLRLLAENRTNMGRMREAEKFHNAARRLSQEAMEGELDVRVYLRTGRLTAAQAALEKKVLEERAGKIMRAAKSHRESQLVLSLIYSYLGEREKAIEAAQSGMVLGKSLKSPFVEAVAYMRMGHGRQLQHMVDPSQAHEAEACYLSAIQRCEELGVRRGKAEAFMGLCLLYGFLGEMAKAERYGREGLEICQEAGDMWLAGFVTLAIGIARLHGGALASAEEMLRGAVKAFVEIGDNFGLCLSYLWLSVACYRQEKWEDFKRVVERLLETTQIHGYDFLFTRPTLFGLRDLSVFAPLLIEAKHRSIKEDYVSWLLAITGLQDTETHPGYSLYVKTFGGLKVFRGREEVGQKDWQREKAKQLFALLITYRRELLPKDRILELLFPGADYASANRDFKVALNALNNALEPGRTAHKRPFYVVRQGSSYGLNLVSGYWLDVEEFESLISKGNFVVSKNPEEAIDLYTRALELYEGDYLQEYLYEDWCVSERERLLALYLRTASRLSQLLAKRGDYEECINLCERILARDPCWEEAYRIMMFCYAKQGRRSAAIRTYERCVERLMTDLKVPPMPQTERLYKKILGSEGVDIGEW